MNNPLVFAFSGFQRLPPSRGRMGFSFSNFFLLMWASDPRPRKRTPPSPASAPLHTRAVGVPAASGSNPGAMPSASSPVRQALERDAHQRQGEAAVPGLPEQVRFGESGHPARHWRLGQGPQREQCPRSLGRKQICNVVAHSRPEGGDKAAEPPLCESSTPQCRPSPCTRPPSPPGHGALAFPRAVGD